MPNDRHESSVQPRKKSDITQIGRHPASEISLRKPSKGSFNFSVALKNVRRRSMEGRRDVFSHPSGNSGTWGNGKTHSEIRGWLKTSEVMYGALSGVVMIVTVRPRQERALERSSNGRVWPCAMVGKMTTWGGEAEAIGEMAGKKFLKFLYEF
ncbi:hypothetical protein U1Q18_006275 [Sarracenia purpurea var. burkii]